MKSLFKRKSIDSLLDKFEGDNCELKKSLTALNLTALGVGGIIGAGIFVITGQAAAQYTGPAIVFSMIFSAIACAFAGLCYAEFASMIPIAGSAYTYAYATLGELFAWIIGWDLILEYLFGASTVAVGWSGYVVSFFRDLGINIPPALSSAPLIYSATTGWHTSGAIINIPAILIIGAITTLLIIGIKETANFNNIIVFIKIAVILLFIIFGMSFINTANWVPFIPENTGQFGHFGWSGIFRGAGVIFFAYIGFDAVSTAAQESKNPKRDMPLSIMGSLAIATVLYILVALVLTGIVKYDQLLVADPIAVGVNVAGAKLLWLRPVVKIGAIAGLSSVLLVMFLGQTRVFYAMAHDGLLPFFFARVHSRCRTPYIATIITGVVAAIISGLFPISILGEMVSIGTLLAFVIVCIGVLVLRYNQPNIKRPFRAPFFPFVPILGAGLSLTQMVFLPRDTWLRLLVWMAFGLVIFFFYGRKHSTLRYEEVCDIDPKSK